ncbi:MAG: glycosyltransferase family 4 protein [Actinobacteria bacterium]|nr:MAG: glycosyltransferase family 4 protein [Actinomycetota bacterium]
MRRLGVRAEIAAYPRNLEGVELPPGTRARAVSAAELRELYAGAACVVVPQRGQEYPYGSEGGGLTSLLETLAMGRPLVATDRPILRDYVTDGETALVVPPEEPEALAAAIRRVLDDGELARRVGEAGRARVEAELTTRHFAERIAPILRTAEA